MDSKNGDKQIHTKSGELKIFLLLIHRFFQFNPYIRSVYTNIDRCFLSNEYNYYIHPFSSKDLFFLKSVPSIIL